MSVFSAGWWGTRQATLQFTARVGRPEASAVAHGRSGMAHPCKKGHKVCCHAHSTARAPAPTSPTPCLSDRGVSCAPLKGRWLPGVRPRRPLWLDTCRHRGQILYGRPPILLFRFLRRTGSLECMSVFSAGWWGTRQATLPFTARMGRPEASAVAHGRSGMAHLCLEQGSLCPKIFNTAC